MTIKLYSDTPLQHPTVHKLADKYHTHSHRNKGYTNNFVLGHYTAIKTGLLCVRASGKEVSLSSYHASVSGQPYISHSLRGYLYLGLRIYIYKP